MFNQLSNAEVQDLYKAISTNNFAKIGGIANQTGGAALIPESLENTLRTLTFTEQNLRLWRNLSKTKAYSTVEEHNVINSYGEDISAFSPEGMAGIDTTGNYTREFAKVKCLNTTRSVTNLMTLVRTVEDPIALETQSGMRYLLGQAERALFYGDSTLAANKEEGLEFDGILKQADESNTIDLRGKHLTDVEMNKASERVLNNYGIPTAAYMPIPVTSIFSEQYYPNQRALMNVQAGEVTAGTMVTQFNSIGGTVSIEPDVFMRRGLEALNPTEPAFGIGAPTPVESVTAAEGTETDALFEEGTYKYAVVAYNANGKSVPVQSEAIAVTKDAAKNGVKLTIKNATAQINAPEYFVIYRTEANKDAFYEIARVGATSRDAAATTEFVDKNETLPNTGIAILGDFRDESVTFKQLAPMFKLDYALVEPKHRFGIFLYGMPVVYAPKRFVVIKNIRVDR